MKALRRLNPAYRAHAFTASVGHAVWLDTTSRLRRSYLRAGRLVQHEPPPFRDAWQRELWGDGTEPALGLDELPF